ncbi:asparagine synthetase B [bacterium]|nr:asparagine synthetase B [bacterium]
MEKKLTIAIIVVIIIIGIACSALADRLLIFMDLEQTDHLNAYGAAYWVLEKGHNVEWLLNYRGGSFLTMNSPEIERELRLRGVRYQVIDGSQLAAIYNQIDNSNMEVVLLEKAPKIAVYVPATEDPWDDAVRLALEYVNIPYTTVWDKEVLAGELEQYDWLHLHHEDFTGQYGKFYASYRNAVWYQQAVTINLQMARELGFSKVSEMKKAVTQKIKEYIAGGGFLFAMCSATDTYDIALSAHHTDIVPMEFDGDPPDPSCQDKLDYEECLAFENFQVELNPYVYEHSNIDVPKSMLDRSENAAEANFFTLFEFAAKYDPVPCMLVQNHVGVVKDFLGQNTAFMSALIKKSVTILAEHEGAGIAKYIHGNFGKGTFTFFGGHDPEDYMHLIGDPPTDLNLCKNSPGYRLILNNVLFPAAKKKEHKT